ncbi:hypothetical protein FACS189423_08380 [Bacteroidia bacterium]|nr:hypothetical protein FACS189423_08380 [Bacteroidia bacterium]
MNDGLFAIFIVGIIVLGIYRLFELFVKRKERMAIIEKSLDLANNNELNPSINIPAINFGTLNLSSGALRISLLLMGVGLGCMIAFFIEYNLLDSLSRVNIADWGARNSVERTQFVLYFSFITVFGGLGLLIAYFIESKQSTKKE